jgi:hypothetical protein
VIIRQLLNALIVAKEFMLMEVNGKIMDLEECQLCGAMKIVGEPCSCETQEEGEP